MDEALEGLPVEVRELDKRFVGTLMASGSEAGTEQLANPPADARTAVLAQMLGSKTWHSHDGQPWQLVAEGRMTTVCNGRRLFVCDTEGGPGDSAGTNFGLCPENTLAGDLVVLLVGSDVLHILRQVDVVDGQAVFGLVGEAYVHNWIDGQLVERIQGPNEIGLVGILGAGFLTLR
jgi:hypothetical protein